MKNFSVILAGIVSISCSLTANATSTQNVQQKPDKIVNIALGFDGKCRIVDKNDSKVFYTDFNSKTLNSSSSEPMIWRVISSTNGSPKLIEAISKPTISFTYNKNRVDFVENSYNMQCVKK